jgi:hypothetical protein
MKLYAGAKVVFWSKKKPSDDDVLRIVAQGLLGFHDTILFALLKRINEIAGTDAAARSAMSIRAFFHINTLYSAVCIMSCADANLRTPHLDSQIEGMVQAGLKAFMKDAESLHDEVVRFAGQRVDVINDMMMFVSGKSRTNGETLLIMITIERIFGKENFVERADELVDLGEKMTKSVFQIRADFIKNLKK